ncbi:hypothetical protein, partial [Salmonella sp. SAL4457]|uniref:hypothetical protein n=1 Tax=Salmonella sp. SAL4457 TaxID=3159912 RepID=UPI00397D5E1A
VVMFPDEATRVDRTAKVIETMIRVAYLPQNEVWMTDDARACATWALPNRWHVGLLEVLQLAPLVRVFGAQTLVALRML